VRLYRDVSDGARNNEKDAPGDEIREVGILWRQFSRHGGGGRGGVLAAAFTVYFAQWLVQWLVAGEGTGKSKCTWERQAHPRTEYGGIARTVRR
jgi:hypothetical protein